MVQQAYNSWSDSYDSDTNFTRDLDHVVTVGALKGFRFTRALELGCGTGKNTEFLSTICDKLKALDFSEGMISKAREKITSSNVEFLLADITKSWPVDKESVDIIVCNLVLEHVEDLAFIFSEACRTLTPGGKFLISELHPFRQYQGKKARFERGEEVFEVEAFIHNISDFISTAKTNGLKLIDINEHWHEKDQNSIPRLISFMFQK